MKAKTGYIIAIVILSMLLLGVVTSNVLLKEERNYYRVQMVNFCEITKLQYNLMELYLSEEEMFNLLPEPLNCYELTIEGMK